MKRLMILLGLVVMLAGCSNQQSENNEQEVFNNQESSIEEVEEDYSDIQKKIQQNDEALSRGREYAVQHIVENLVNCEGKCTSKHMTYEDALALSETEAYDEWFKEYFAIPDTRVKRNTNWVEFKSAWLGEQNDGSYKLDSQFANNFEKDVIDFKFNIHIFDRYDKEIQVIELAGGSIPAQSTQYMEHILNVDSEWYSFNCEVVEVEYAEE